MVRYFSEEMENDGNVFCIENCRCEYPEKETLGLNIYDPLKLDQSTHTENEQTMWAPN